MATNVTEKDKTLHEVIDFLQKEWDAANNASDNPDEEVYDFYDGMTTAYEHVINYCRHMLGYSGTMPSEVPNQKRGRGMSGGEMSDANPFGCQRDELTTMDMHTCDLCGRWCSSPVYSVCLCYADQAKVAGEVCADCMWRLKFSPVRTISLDAYRLFEQWRLSQSEADE